RRRSYRPLKSALRFSRKARTPSALSSLLKVSAKRSLSRSRPSRRFIRAADLMASFAIRRAIGLFSAIRDARLMTALRSSAAQTEAVDHRDHRFGKLLDRIENAEPFHRIVLHQGSPALKFVDIGSGNKRLVPGSRDNQDARFRRSLKRIQRLTNLIACRLIQSVSLVGPVDG